MNIPYGKQCITEEDIQSVVDVLRSEFLTQGPKIKEFEDSFAKYIGCNYAVAVANGTAALHLCALALNIQPGHKVITTPITFAATANCVRYCGGEVVFADIDADTYLLDLKKVRKILERSAPGEYKGVIPVDFGGLAVQMDSFKQLAKEFGLWIIEDACHAPGGFFTDATGTKHFCGDGAYADLAIFSFHPVKHIAAGEGGMITTNDFKLYQKLLQLRTHGIVRDKQQFLNEPSLAAADPTASGFPGWYMEMQHLGFNYRLTDFQAALGCSQLQKADERLIRRRQIAKVYDEAFSGHTDLRSGLRELTSKASGHAYHLYVIEAKDRLGLYNHLQKNKIFAQVHYVPTHLMPYYRKFGWNLGDLPIAEKYYSQCLSLPMYPTLTDSEQRYVIDKVLDFYKGEK